jgi:hypothetical protein
MLGFAIVDMQPTAKATAVWLTCHLDGSRVNHTNAVVIPHDDDRHDLKVWNLTADRAVVLTDGTAAPIMFKHSLAVDAFDGLLDETSVYQRRIIDAVADYAKRSKNKNLVAPAFVTNRAELKPDGRDEPAYRALSAANYVRDAWAAWLATDEQRVRRTINPRTGEPPWIMPEDMGSTTVADFPPEFGQLVVPEPLVKPDWVA